MKTDLKNPFVQLCVLEGTTLGDKTPKDFEKQMCEMFGGVEVKYHSQQTTFPSKDSNGKNVGETGGRNALFFYIHQKDISKFAIPRLQAGIRWWEDVLGNGNGHLYSEEFLNDNPSSWV